MCQKHGQVDVIMLVGIGNAAHLFSGILEGNKAADQIIRSDLIHNFFSDDSRKENIVAGHFKYNVRLHQPLIIFIDLKVGVNNNKVGHFFKKEQVRQAVIKLVVTQRHNIGGQVVHDLHR